MAERLEIAALAQRFVDLWQDHLVSVASDPKNIAALTRLVVASAAGLETQAASWREAWMMPPTATKDAGTVRGQPDHEQRPAAEAGTAAATDASSDSDSDVAKLARRVAALEERLSALESGGGGARRTIGRRPRRGSAS